MCFLSQIYIFKAELSKTAPDRDEKSAGTLPALCFFFGLSVHEVEAHKARLLIGNEAQGLVEGADGGRVVRG